MTVSKGIDPNTASSMSQALDAMNATPEERRVACGIIGHESGFNAHAHASGVGQTAAGLGQFINSSWDIAKASLAKNHPELAQRAHSSDQYDPFVATAAVVQSLRDYDSKMLAPKGIPATAAALYSCHFSPAAVQKGLMTAPDNAPLASFFDANSIEKNASIFKQCPTVGDWKRYASSEIAQNALKAEQFVDDNPMFSPGKSLEYVLKDLEDNGKGDQAKRLGEQFNDPAKKHDALTSLRALNESIMVEGGVGEKGKLQATDQHIGLHFGSYNEVKIHKASDDAKLSDLGISADAIKTYMAESKDALKGRLGDTPEDKKLAEILAKDPSEEAKELTAGQLRQFATKRGNMYNEDLEKTRLAAVTGARVGGATQEEQDKIDKEYRERRIGEDGTMNFGMMIALLLVALLMGGEKGGAMISKLMGGPSEAPGSQQAANDSPSQGPTGATMPPSVTGGTQVATGTSVPAPRNGPGAGAAMGYG